jgi:hypothetical protein
VGMGRETVQPRCHKTVTAHVADDSSESSDSIRAAPNDRPPWRQRLP